MALCWVAGLADSFPSSPVEAQVPEHPLLPVEVQALSLRQALLMQCSLPADPAGPVNRMSHRWRWDQLWTLLLL